MLLARPAVQFVTASSAFSHQLWLRNVGNTMYLRLVMIIQTHLICFPASFPKVCGYIFDEDPRYLSILEEYLQEFQYKGIYFC